MIASGAVPVGVSASPASLFALVSDRRLSSGMLARSGGVFLSLGKTEMRLRLRDAIVRSFAQEHAESFEDAARTLCPAKNHGRLVLLRTSTVGVYQKLRLRGATE